MEKCPGSNVHLIGLLLCILFMCPFFSPIQSQNNRIDSLKYELTLQKEDSLTMLDYRYLWQDYMSEDLDSAYQYAVRGLYFSQKAKIATGIADFTVYAAYVLNQQGQKDAALSMMKEQLINLEKNFSFLRGELFLQQWIAETYIENNQIDSALVFYEQMYSRTEGIHPLFSVAANVGLGEIYQSKSLFKTALYYYQLADSICLTNNIDANTCTTSRTNTGVILTEISDYENANIYFEKVRIEYQSRNEEYLLQELNFIQSRTLYHLKELDRATRLVEEGIKYFEKQKAILKLTDGYETFILIKSKQRDYDQVEKAVNQYFKIAHELNDSLRIVKSYIERANNNNNLGYPEESLADLNSVGPFIDQSEDLLLKQFYAKVLTGVYKKLRNWEAAYLTSVDQYDYTNIINSEKNARNIKEMEIAYDIKNKEQHIALLNSENELVKQKQANQNFAMVAGFTMLGLISFVLFYSNRLKQKTNERLKDLDQIKSRFFTNISHELRTPITLISNPLDIIINEGKVDPATKSRLQMVKRNSSKLQFLVDDLLDLTKIQAGNYNLSVYKIDGNQHIRVLLSNFESLKFLKDQEYEQSVRLDIDTLYYDPKVIDTICSNILSNAFKYCPVGAVISAAIYLDKTDLVINISDDGPGIAGKDQELIFDRFYQAENIPNFTPGLGIGLALVKEMVQAHFGSITLESEIGEGTVFNIRIPSNKSFYRSKNIPIRDDWNKISVSTSLKSAIDETSLNGPVTSDLPILLLVEDNIDMRTHLKDLFSPEYQVIEAGDGKEGVQKALSEVPDIIISDMMMPLMDGSEMSERLKEDPRVSHIPIIILTAKAEEEAKIATLRIGVDDYIAKPFNNDELLIKTRNQIRQRERLRARYLADHSLNYAALSTNQTDKIFWEALDLVLTKHFDNHEFSVDQFSKEMHMSRMQLHRKIKALSNMSASIFLRNYRLKKALELLQSGSLNVSEVAYDSGFSSPSYFSKCFKELYGVAPSEYELA